MFNVGGGELIVIMLIALIVLGPQRLPDAARQIGKVMGDLRRLSSGFQSEMRSALDTADDPDRIADRRNMLAKEPPAAAPSKDHPVRKEPLVAGPEGRPPSAQARAAAKKQTAARPGSTAAASPAKKPAAKNGTAVKKTGKAATPRAKP